MVDEAGSDEPGAAGDEKSTNHQRRPSTLSEAPFIPPSFHRAVPEEGVAGHRARARGSSLLRCDAVCHRRGPGGQRARVVEFAANDQRRDVVPVYPERLNDLAIRGAETVPGRWMCRCGRRPGAEDSLR